MFLTSLEGDCSALYTFGFHSTNAGDVLNWSSFNLTDPIWCCADTEPYPSGLTCTGNRITSFVAPSLQLEGFFDESFNSLDGLTFLDLSNNTYLYGSLTPLVTLHNLQEIWLADNFFTGSLSLFGQLTSLSSLSLKHNLLTGDLAGLSALSALNFLSVGRNYLTGSVSPLSHLVSLDTLELYDNELTGSLDSLSVLIHLKHLFISNNQFGTSTFTQTLDFLQNLTELTLFYSSRNQIGGT